MAENQELIRPGPRPLPLHLATANLILLSSLAAWPIARQGLPLSRPGVLPLQNAADLAAGLQSLPPEDFARALAAEVLARLQHFDTGIQRYRTNAARPRLPEPPVLWQEGTSRLLDYGPGDGMPVLLVPSLVNRHYVLDLAPGQSLVRYLRGRGLRPLLVDWGSPAGPELDFDLAAYVGRLVRWLKRLRKLGSRPFPLVGYCMGGNLALAAALQAPRSVAALALLATPWDFHAGGAHQADLVRHLAPMLAPPAPEPGTPPAALAVDILQAFFWALDPLGALKKFSHFANLAPDSDAARQFIAMEDWLNDGIPLAGAVARECLLDWYGNNMPARGEWRLGGRVVRPEDWAGQSLVVLPERDRLVPKASAEALLARLPTAARHEAPSGHIGMMVGPRAEAGLWRPLGDWLQALDTDT